MAVDVTNPEELDEGTRRAVRELAALLERTYDAPPLSDQALTRLGDGSVRHYVARRDGDVVGYGQLDGASLEVAAKADAVPALLDAAVPTAPTDGLWVWSHGKRSPLAPALADRGFERARVLHRMHRPLRAEPEVRPLPPGVVVRAFVPGQDEQEWLRVNAAAFADHPEQGSWGIGDVLAREAEPWFDPAGFLLAERDGRLVGFHWTKIHADGSGEVYVLGVDPSAQGLRLGPALLDRGLAYLAARGCPEVLLYVDDSNSTAVQLYERSGFAIADTDIQWRR